MLIGRHTTRVKVGQDKKVQRYTLQSYITPQPQPQPILTHSILIFQFQAYIHNSLSVDRTNIKKSPLSLVTPSPPYFYHHLRRCRCCRRSSFYRFCFSILTKQNPSNQFVIVDKRTRENKESKKRKKEEQFNSLQLVRPFTFQSLALTVFLFMYIGDRTSGRYIRHVNVNDRMGRGMKIYNVVVLCSWVFAKKIDEKGA